MIVVVAAAGDDAVLLSSFVIVVVTVVVAAAAGDDAVLFSPFVIDVVVAATGDDAVGVLREGQARTDIEGACGVELVVAGGGEGGAARLRSRRQCGNRIPESNVPAGQHNLGRQRDGGVGVDQ